MHLGKRPRLLLQLSIGALGWPAAPWEAHALLEEEGVVALALVEPLDGAGEHGAHRRGKDVLVAPLALAQPEAA
eukprot:2073457-Alexandrium_andersonii.AAC.1